MSTKLVSKLLVAAKGHLMKGWCQNQSHKTHDGEVACCAIGALDLALEDALIDNPTDVVQLARHEAANVLSQVLPNSRFQASEVSVAFYNDDKGRTQQEVLNLYDSAIWRAQELGW